MSAGVRRVVFSDITVSCLNTKCKHGSYIKTCRGRGGIVEDVEFVGVSVVGAGFGHGVTLEYVRNLPPTNATATPVVRNVTYRSGSVGPTVNVAYEFQGLPDSELTGVIVANQTLISGVPLCNDCANTSGACIDGTLPSSCPPCLQEGL